MARHYRMTPKRKAALRKAQAASARKRRHGRNRRLKIAGGVTVVAATATAAGVAYARYRPSVVHQRKAAEVRQRGSKHRGGPTLSWHRGLDIVRHPANLTNVRAMKVGTPANARQRRESAAERLWNMYNEAGKTRAKKNPARLRREHKRTMKKLRKTPVPRRNRFTRAAAVRLRKQK